MLPTLSTHKNVSKYIKHMILLFYKCFDQQREKKTEFQTHPKKYKIRRLLSDDHKHKISNSLVSTVTHTLDAVRDKN